MANKAEILQKPKEQLLPRCILRLSEVEKRTGYKRAYIYREMKENRFPQNVKIGNHSVGWDSYAIDNWVNEKLGVYKSNAKEQRC